MTRALRVAAAIGFLLALLQAIVPARQAPRFYPDDPLTAEPAPLPVSDPQRRALSAVLEAVTNSFSDTGQRQPATGVILARGVNTLGEVMDGDWYVNRQAARRLTAAELQRGPGRDLPPAMTAPWQVLVVKPFGVNSGLLVADAKNDLYLLRFDPEGHAGLATGAQIVTSRFLYALGYFVVDDYLVQFDRTQLVAHPSGQTVSSAGKPRGLVTEDIDAFLKAIPQEAGGTYRTVATRLPERREGLLGPYQVWGTRSDDPNDTVPHEHRRDLRGLSVFAAWLNISNMRAVGTQDILLTADGRPRIRHFIVDLTKSLGSGVFDGPKLSWEGNETVFPSLGDIGHNIATLGLSTPAWMKEKFPDLPEVGAFGSAAFDPNAWTTSEPIAPFKNRLPDDAFWAARQVMAFSDDEIRAVVKTGQYAQAAEDWITATLIERRNRVGRTFLATVLPLDRIRIENGVLAFDDLGVKYQFAAPRTFTIDWYGFDNANDALTTNMGAGPGIPAGVQALPAGSYVAARVFSGDEAMNVTVYLRREATGARIVGIDRAWPGKIAVNPPAPARADRRVYEDLAPRQRELFVTYVDSYNAARGRRYTPEEIFERLTVSEQTTFYGVTHALLHSPLTDAGGASLGLAIDRVLAVERIAGQYEGRGGDEQFRLYVRLKPDTRTVLESSREFFRDHENTVYHVGYPHSFRQVGKEPDMQISMSDDGLKADIDVDYRSSKSPQALFNGHLTASNSDIRAGENPTLHAERWQGLVQWWRNIFGNLKEALPQRTDMLGLDLPDGPPTPLPPDRPINAAPDRLEDAAQEFLTDWLLRRQYDQALAVLSTRSYACLALKGDGKGVPLDAAGARRELRRLMEYSTKELGKRSDLTSVIKASVPRDPNRVVVDHAFRREFLITPLTETEARQYLCDASAAQPSGAQYFGVVFTMRTQGGGTLGLLWAREAGVWKIVSYQLLEQ
jgi:hypothetical protein